MTPRIILLSTIAVLLTGCDRPGGGVAEAQRAAEQERERQTANEEIRQLKQRLDEADRQKAADREAEYGRTKEELAQARQERAQMEEKLRQLEAEARPAREERPAAVGETPHGAIDEDEDADPVYAGRVVPEEQRVASVNSFYQPLDAYGDWIETDDYGYVFRPHLAVRSADWRPYTDGRWTYTEYGWTWESNEDFGWATYHYGRWAQIHGAGWVWVPGREWAPAWVSWRRGDEFCGWAPLPPESRGRVSFTAAVDRDYDLGPSAYVFVAFSNFGVQSYTQCIEPPVRNTVIVSKTVNVTNITYNTVNNKTVVFNGGPRYEVVKAKSKQPVSRARVAFGAPSSDGPGFKAGNMRTGDALRVVAPPVNGSTPAVPPKVKEKLGKAKIDKGWQGVDTAQAAQIKQEMAASSVERKKRPNRPGEAGTLPPGAGGPATDRPVNVTATPAKDEPATLPNPPRPRPAGPVERPARLDREEKVIPPVSPSSPAVAPDAVPEPKNPRRIGDEARPATPARPQGPVSTPETPARPHPSLPTPVTPPRVPGNRPILPPPSVVPSPSETPELQVLPRAPRPQREGDVRRGDAAPEPRVRRVEPQPEAAHPVEPRNPGIVPPPVERRPRDFRAPGMSPEAPAEDASRGGQRSNGGSVGPRPGQFQSAPAAGPTPFPNDPSGLKRKKDKNNGA